MCQAFYFQTIMAVEEIFFQDSRLEKVDKTGEQFKNWLLPNFSNSAEALCVICFWKRFDIKGGGMRQVNQHANSKTHKKLIKILQEKKRQDSRVSSTTFI